MASPFPPSCHVANTYFTIGTLLPPPPIKIKTSGVKYGSVPDFAAEAVMIGKWVVVGSCRMTITTWNGGVNISLKG